MSHVRGVSEVGEAGQRVPQKGSDARLQQSWAQGDALDPAQPGGDSKSFRKHWLIRIFACFSGLF